MRRPLALACSVAALALLLALPGTAGAATCNFAGGTVTLEPEGANGPMAVGIQGDEIWFGFQGLSQQCSTATRSNTDQINMNGDATNNVVFVILSGGLPAPGATPELLSTSEIEIDIFGGGGNDTLVVSGGDAGEQLHFGDQEVGAGTDLGANFNADNDSNDIEFDAAVKTLIARGHDGDDTISYAGGVPGPPEPIPASVNTQELNGGPGDDVLTGGPGVDSITGDEGDDTLQGGAGIDTLTPGPGDDIANGGPGTDTLSHNSSAGVRIDLGESGPQDTLGAGIDTFTGFERLNGGFGPDTLIGSDSAEQIQGSSGNDLVIGRGGDDTLSGDNGSDTVSYELPPAGATQGVTADLSLQGSMGPEASGGAGDDSLSGFEHLTGSPFADELTGDDNANTLVGLGGADVLSALGGDDFLYVRDAGPDTAACGAGQDTVARDEPGVDSLAADCETQRTLDTTLTPAQSSPTSDNTPSFGVAASEPDATLECSVDGSAFAACATQFTTAELSDGEHNVRARAVDTSGFPDASPAEASVTVDATSPLVSGLKIAKAFRVARKPTPLSAAKRKRARRGSAFAYELSEAAAVTIAIERKAKGRRFKGKCRKPTRKLRKRPKCARFVAKGTLRRAGTAGANKIAFSGRLGAKKLAPGRYRATLVATDGVGNVSQSARVAFGIVR